MSMDDNDGQMIFGDLAGLKFPNICLTGEEKPRKNLTQETCPDRESNPGPLRDKRACYHLHHSGGREYYTCTQANIENVVTTTLRIHTPFNIGLINHITPRNIHFDL